VHIITHRTIKEFAEQHATARTWLDNWYRVAKKAVWKELKDVQAVYQTADQVENCLIFDKGNDFRLIVRVLWATEKRQGVLFVKKFLTHAEYTKGRWKRCCK
jgi:mRNA interferase HigB